MLARACGGERGCPGGQPVCGAPGRCPSAALRKSDFSSVDRGEAATVHVWFTFTQTTVAMKDIQ